MRKLASILIIGTLVAILVAVCPPASIMKAPSDPAPNNTPGAPVVSDQARQDAPGVYDFREFLNALMQVESGGNPKAVGDGGASKGLYQIGKAYWIDGKGDVTYETGVLDKDKCEAVMFNYWSRYCEEALYEIDYETLARVHNGGPRGESKPSTKQYWRKVKAALQKGTGQ